MAISPWLVESIGLVAGVCTTAAFLPQAIRVWRLKRADEISFTTFLAFSVGTIVWLLYGLLIGSIPVILANAITTVLALTILWMKLRYDRVQRIGAPLHVS
ncbi:MAG TPA: SemiSWEET transporter [Thermoplasmata archaeon]|nr:SemiSWEET transporter [Thermoplasmata archaeon]